MFLLYPSTTFRQVQEVGELVQENVPGTNLIFFETDPTVGVPSTFGSAIFIFQAPERYAYLSTTYKISTYLCTIGRTHTYSKYRTLTLVFTNNYISGTKQQTRTHTSVLHTQQTPRKYFKSETKNTRCVSITFSL